jgi:uncharacterized membrane protein
VIDDFLSELDSRLRSLGVRGASLDRVLAEARDHLEESGRHDVDPVARFGDPKLFARQVASELGVARTCRATYATFGALAAAGVGFVLALALVPAAGGWPDLFGGHVAVLGPVLGLVLVAFPQIAFVSGCLALLRALRLRIAPGARSEQLALLRRRSNVALVTTGAALAALAALAVNDEGELAIWWTWSTIALCVVLVPPLAGAAYVVSDSGCPYVEPGGSEGDIFDDLGRVFRLRPLQRLGFPDHPWRFALVCAAGVGATGFAAGWYAEGDPGSGLVRGGFEAAAFVICFAALGRKLALRRSN